MPDTNGDICIRITLINPQGQALGGTANLELKPQRGGNATTVKGADASKAIDVSGLDRTPPGLYQLTVTPGGAFKQVSQSVTVPASGIGTVRITMEAATPVDTTAVVVA